MSGINTNRTNVSLPAEVASEILQKTQQASAIMRLARQIHLPGHGVQIPVITSDPDAAWVGETGKKPVSNPGLSTKLMQAYKLAVIVPFSDEFRRDAASLYDALIARLPLALAQKFDQTVVGAVPAPGGNFDTFVDCTAQSLVGNAYEGLVNAYADIANHGGSLNGFALSPSAVGMLLGSTDTTGRPIFNMPSDGSVNRVLGAQTVESRGMYNLDEEGPGEIVGVAGDWSQAMYGTVEGVQIRFADQTGLTINSEQVNLWEHNMFAVRAEIELGFRADTNCFNLLLGDVG